MRFRAVATSLSVCLIPCGAILAQSPAPLPVQVTRVQTQALTRSTTVQAEVLPLEFTAVVPQVTGILRRLAVKEGDVVEQGATLAELTCPDLEADLQIARASHAEATAMVDVATSSLQAAGEAVKVSQADTHAALTAEKAAALGAKLAQVDSDRTAALHRQEAATLEEVEHMQLALERAKAALEAARSATAATQARLGESGAEVGVMAARLASAKASEQRAKGIAARAEVMLDFATLTNPYPSARVTRQVTDPGTLIKAHETAVLEIMNATRVRVRFGVPMVEAHLVAPGTQLRIIQPRSQAEDVSTTVTRVTGAITRNSRSMFAEAELDNADGRWLPGALVQVELVLLQQDDAITLPSQALIKRGANAHVWVVTKGQAARVPVKLGADLGRRVQILSGLTAGQRVVLAGQSALTEGRAVSPSEVQD